MSNTKQDYDIDMSKPSKDGEADIAVAEAIPQPNSNEPPIPAGHARFYCSKCHTVRMIQNCNDELFLLSPFWWKSCVNAEELLLDTKQMQNSHQCTLFILLFHCFFICKS
jgi:hypothetical protein